MTDENMPHQTEMQTMNHEQEARDFRIRQEVANVSQFLKRLRSSVSSEPVRLREITVNPDDAFERALEINKKAERNLRGVARLVNFLKNNAEGERNRNVAESEKTSKMLLRVAFMVALSRTLIDKITDKITSNVKVETQPKEKDGRFKTLLAAAVSLPMAGASFTAASENATQQDVEAALRNEGEAPQTLNIDEDGLGSASSFDEVEAKCREIEVLMAELQVQLPELNTSMASISIPDGVDGQNFRMDLEAEFEQICADLGIDSEGGISELIVAEEGDEEAPPPPEDPEAATMTAEEAILRLGEGEIVSRVELPNLVIETTQAHVDQFGDTVDNMLLRDENIPMQLKVDTITEMVHEFTDESPSREDVEANIDYYLGLLSENRIAIPAIDNIWIREGGLSDFISPEEFMNARPRVIRIGNNFEGATNEALVNRAENSPAVVEMFITSEGELVFVIQNEEITEKTPNPQFTNDLSMHEYNEVSLMRAELYVAAGVDPSDLTASAYYILSQYIQQ